MVLRLFRIGVAAQDLPERTGKIVSERCCPATAQLAVCAYLRICIREARGIGVGIRGTFLVRDRETGGLPNRLHA